MGLKVEKLFIMKNNNILKIIYFLFYYIYQIIINIIFFLVLLVPIFFLFILNDKDKRSIIATKSFKIFYPILFKLIFLELIFIDPYKLLKKSLSEPTMFIFNHTHPIDPFMAGQGLPTNNVWLAKGAIIKYPIIGFLLKYSNILIPVKKEKTFLESIDNILHKIKLNKNKPSIGAFPEGYISNNKKIKLFKSGPFYIAIKQKMPICMIYIEDCTQGFNINPFLLNPGSMKYHVLEIIQTNNISLKDIDGFKKKAEERYLSKQIELEK